MRPSEAASVIVIGSINADLVADVESLPLRGETIHALNFQQHLGGKGANQAAAAAMLGTNVAMIGCVGDDGVGARALQGLDDVEVRRDRVQIVAGVLTGTALITVDKRGDNTIVVAPGANDKLTVGDVQTAGVGLASCAAVALQLEVPDDVVLAAARVVGKLRGSAATKKPWLVFNPSPFRTSALPPKGSIDLLLVNELAAEAMSGIPVHDPADAVEAARKLLDAQRLGIRIIHQEFNLINDVSIVENMFLETLGHKPWTFVSHRRLRTRARAVLQDLGLRVSPDTLVREFPMSVDALTEYDVILLSDIGSNSLYLHPDTFTRSEKTPDRLALLRQYVEQGGGLVMIGGYMSFSGINAVASYQKTPVADVLPAVMVDGDDRVEVPDGATIEIVVEDHPVVVGIPGPWPQFLGYNQLQERPDTTVIARRGDDVFIAVGQYGQGRSLVFASDCGPHWGPPEFVNWEHYGLFWAQAVRWRPGGLVDGRDRWMRFVSAIGLPARGAARTHRVAGHGALLARPDQAGRPHVSNGKISLHAGGRAVRAT